VRHAYPQVFHWIFARELYAQAEVYAVLPWALARPSVQQMRGMALREINEIGQGYEN